jgi:hypothetical protein
MKRQKLIKHLLINNCELEREGANHSWYKNIKTGYRSSVPRHTEILFNIAFAKECLIKIMFYVVN